MSKDLKFNSDVKEKFLNGVEKLANSVKVTLGPGGRLVMLDKKYGVPILTKDGVSVAKEIDLKDPFENMGAKMVKEVSSKTNDDTGDGTTTSTVLAYSMIKNGFKFTKKGGNPILIKNGIDKTCKLVVDSIKKQSRDIKSNEDILNVASISANNDKEIGAIISEAIEIVGKDGVITVEESMNYETNIETVEGMQFDRGYMNQYFVTDKERMESILNEPYVLIYDGEISSMKDMVHILEDVNSVNRPILIIADDIKGEAITSLVLNHINGVIKCCCVKSPSFGDKKKEMLEDIAILTGGKVITKDLGLSLANVTLNDLGTCDSIKISNNETTIIGGNGDCESIKERVNEIKNKIKLSKSSYEKENLEKRLAKLSGGIALIKIGGVTESEIKEKKYRIEDTLASTRSALEDGIVIGGGMALINAKKDIMENHYKDFKGDELIGFNIVMSAIEEPLKQIAENCGYNSKKILNKAKSFEIGSNIGFNALTNEWVEMFDNGIIDPTKVTCTALINACSISGMLLITECGISDELNEEHIN